MKIKKIFAALLACVMMLCISTSAMAATYADGNYNISVDIAGGTGKVKVTSCKLKVAGGKMTADIVLSSKGYSWIKINGVQYNNSNTGGNSTFTNVAIPALDQGVAVSGETTTMSEPHVIDYTWTFSSNGVKTADTTQAPAQHSPANNATTNNNTTGNNAATTQSKTAQSSSVEAYSSVEASSTVALSEATVEEESNEGFPVWAIVLIAVVVVAAVAGGVVVYNKKKANK